MTQSTQTLIIKALTINDSILTILNRFTHSKSICDKLCNKIINSQKFIYDLKLKYDNHFEQPSYQSGFSNYVAVLENCLNFIEAIEKKALFVRLVNGDKYKKSFYRLFIDIDQAVSVLNLGHSVKDYLSQSIVPEGTNFHQHKGTSLMVTRKTGLDDIIAEAGQRDVLMEGIRTVQQDKLSNKDILASVEIHQRHIKSIPGSVPRLGHRYIVHKRLYNGQVVAEKTLREKLGDEDFVMNLRKQVAVLKQLAVCPFIIKFIGVSVKGNKLCLITAYAELGHLKGLLDSTHQLNNELKFRFTLDIVEGIAFLHEMGVLHKNIKTSSILITEDYKARISGFDFSREVTSGTTVIKDDDSDRYRWIPPEKFSRGLGSSTHSDVYSLGMVIWSIWSQRYPYEMLCQQAIEDLVSHGGREDLALVPIELRSVIIACWQHDANKRPDASYIIDALDTIACHPNECISSVMQDSWSERSSYSLDSYPNEKSPEFQPDLNSLHHSFSHSKLSQNEFPLMDSSHPSISSDSKSSSKSSLRTSSIDSPHRSTPLNHVTPLPSVPLLDQFEGLSISSPPTKPNSLPSHRKVISSQRSIAESRLNQFERKKFEPNLLVTRREFRETLLGKFDKTEGEGLDLVDPEYAVTLDDALDHHNAGRRQQSFQAFTILIKKGEPKAHYYLGYYYFWGQDGVVSKDWYRALHHFQLAADANDSDALDHLGIYYATEENPDKNLVKAKDYYQRAAELGNKKGYYHLGVCYAKGRGTTVNKELALMNIKEAAHRGHILAMEQINRARSR